MNSNSPVMMGTLPPQWEEGRAKSITFCVTEDCNLACKYCYLTGKNSHKKMSFKTAKMAVDYILSNRDEFPESSVIWEFIGGEPFMEIDLIDRICDYIKLQMYTKGHPWFNCYRFNFSTNGLLYGTPKVQEYIKKNRGHISIGISIDGNKVKHDLQRVKIDGSGSYDEVVKNVPLWLEQFPKSGTKATFAHDDLPYLKDSIIDLWNLGIKMVSANVVFENVWEDGDDEIIESQLKELADYVLENGMWEDCSVRFFDPRIGFPLSDEAKQSNYCGAGKMLAIDCNGNFFPCVRFYDFSLNNRKGLKIGSVYEGINHDKIRPFLALSLKAQSKQECVECEVASGCAWCQGCNYDCADTQTIYQRAVYLCKIHKATVRANKYFWEKYEEVTGLQSERRKIEMESDIHLQNIDSPKCLQFITSDNITPHCSYRNTKGTDAVMSEDTFRNGMEFCRKNKYTPVLLGKPDHTNIDQEEYLLIDSALSNSQSDISVHDNAIELSDSNHNTILLINSKNNHNLFRLVRDLFKVTYRINLILEDIEKWGKQDIEEYEHQLDLIVPLITDSYKAGNPLELSILTDIWNLKSMRNCDAGVDTFSLAPNGRIYMCPAFYFDDPESYIGTLEQGIQINNPQLLELENAPICSACDVYSCRRCKYLNRKLTNELNTPSRIQCTIGHIERKKSMELQRLVTQIALEIFNNNLREIDYTDPLDKLLKEGSACNA